MQARNTALKVRKHDGAVFAAVWNWSDLHGNLCDYTQCAYKQCIENVFSSPSFSFLYSFVILTYV